MKQKLLFFLILSGIGSMALSTLAADSAAEAESGSDTTEKPTDRAAELQEAWMARVTEELKLSDEQAAAVRAVFEANADERAELMERLRDAERLRERRKIGKEMSALRDETDKQLKEILSEEQFEQWTVLRDEARGEMRDRLRERRAE